MRISKIPKVAIAWFLLILMGLGVIAISALVFSGGYHLAGLMIGIFGTTPIAWGLYKALGALADWLLGLR